MSTSTVAIDVLVPINSIHVDGRHRRDLGDVQMLADSIADVGLLNPITLTRERRLVAGERRLSACRLLGWAEMPARFIDNIDDAAHLLRAERDENVCRKDMLPSELVALGRQLEELERPKARKRQREGASRGGRREGSGTETGSSSLTTVEAVGDALGISGSSYRRAKVLVTAAENGDKRAAAAVEKMDRTRRITPAYNSYKHRPSAPTGKRPEVEPFSEAKSGPEPEPEERGWVPEPNDKTRAAALRRRELLREMAPQGYTSGQIGDLLKIDAATIRRIAKGEGVEIVADRVMGRSRKSVDSNRVIRETVQDLENMEMSIHLVNFGELDVTQIEYWTASLSKSIRMLNRLNKELKERSSEH